MKRLSSPLTLISLPVFYLLSLTSPLHSISPWFTGTPVSAQAKPTPQKTIKSLLGAIRYQKDEHALKKFNGEAQGALIFGDDWSKKTPEERQRFINALHAFFTHMAFPNIREKYFKHIETILYGEPQELEGGAMKLRATIVILHMLKKEEIPADFMLRANQEGDWLIEDFWIAPKDAGSQSFITRMRDEQILPLFKKKGWDGLLKAMEKRVTDLKKRVADSKK